LTGNLTLNVTVPLQVVTTTLPGATTGVAYSFQLVGDGGLAPYTWSRSAGALPSGLLLNGTTGVISGTPNVSGTFSYTVKMTDKNRKSVTRVFSLVVSP
jgi:hypothetical protein